MGYDSINQPVVAQIPSDTKSLLDVGCGGGGMGGLLKAKLGCSVVGVTFDESEAVVARQRLDRVEVQDLNSFDITGLGKFDCILCSHVLEHLYRPEELLVKLRSCLNPGGSLVMAIPNLLFWHQRLKLMCGQFRYADGGTMDRTHYRFYDWKCARTAHQCWLRNSLQGCGRWFSVDSLLVGLGAAHLDGLAVYWFPGFYGWQFIFRCQVPEQEVAKPEKPPTAAV